MSVLVSGSDAFAARMAAMMEGLPGIRVVGCSPGNDMPVELTRAGWPDVTIIDAGTGRRVGEGSGSYELKGAGGRSDVVMIVDPETDLTGDPPRIAFWRGWSVLLAECAQRPPLLMSAVQSAARGGCVHRSLHRRIDDRVPGSHADAATADGLRVMWAGSPQGVGGSGAAPHRLRGSSLTLRRPGRAKAAPPSIASDRPEPR